MVSTLEGLSTSAAARRLGVAAETLRAWVRQDTLPATQTPLGLVFDAGDVERLRLSRAQAAETPRIRTRQIGRGAPA